MTITKTPTGCRANHNFLQYQDQVVLDYAMANYSFLLPLNEEQTSEQWIELIKAYSSSKQADIICTVIKKA